MSAPDEAGELVRARAAARAAAETSGTAALLVGSTGFALGAAALAVPQAAWAHGLAALATIVCAVAATLWLRRHHQLAAAARSLAASADFDVESGLPGQAALERELARALAEAQRTNRPISIVMVTIDELRALHLERGLAAGRRLLFQTGVALTSICAPHAGSAYRGPGATIVALLPGSSLAQAERIAQKASPALQLLVRRNGGLVRLAAGAAVGLAGDLAEDTLLRAERRCVRGPAAGAESGPSVLRAVPPPT